MSNILKFVILGILIIGIPVGVKLAQDRQILKSRAEFCEPTCETQVPNTCVGQPVFDGCGDYCGTGMNTGFCNPSVAATRCTYEEFEGTCGRICYGTKDCSTPSCTNSSCGSHGACGSNETCEQVGATPGDCTCVAVPSSSCTNTECMGTNCSAQGKVCSIIGVGDCYCSDPSPGGGGGQVCTPYSYQNIECSEQCGGCESDAGEQLFQQCKGDGSGWEDKSQCSTDCAGYCDGPPTYCTPGELREFEPSRDCLQNCSTGCLSQGKGDARIAQCRPEGDGYTVSGTECRSECASYCSADSTPIPTSTPTPTYTPFPTSTPNPTATPTSGVCSVASWNLSNENPSVNSTVTVRATAGSDSSNPKWQNVVYKVDNGSWVSQGVRVENGPTFVFDINAGSAGSHTLTLGTNGGTRTCSGVKTFATGGSSGPCSVSWTLPSDTPAVNTEMTVRVNGISDSGGWTFVKWRMDNGSWNWNTSDRVVSTGSSPVFEFKTNSGAAGQHTLEFSAGNGSRICTPAKTFNSVSSLPTPSPSSSLAPTPTPAPAVFTVSFRVAENPTDLSTASWQPYTTEPMSVDFEFRDKTPGPKSVFVEFKGSDGRVERRTAQIRLLGPDPVITACSLKFEANNNTVLNLSGRDFGSEKGTAKSTVEGSDVNLQVREWKSGTIKAVWPNAPVGQTLPVVVTNPDGQSAEGSCSSISQLALGAKVFCRAPSSHDTDNVDLLLIDERGTKVRQKVRIDKEGIVQGLTQRLEDGLRYILSLKAPRSIRKNAAFTAGDGTTNIPNFLLPVGDVFPADGGDGKINTFDHNELVRQWSIAKDVSNRSGDFNRDSRVNSFDWACMRYDFNSEDDPIPSAVPSPSPSPSPDVSPSVSVIVPSSPSPNPTVSSSPGSSPSPSPSVNPSPTPATSPSPSTVSNSCGVTGITCGNTTATSITINNISMTDNGWGADGMAVYLKGGVIRNYVNSASSYTVNNLTPGTTYDIKVGCYKDTGVPVPQTTGWTNTITCATQ